MDFMHYLLLLSLAGIFLLFVVPRLRGRLMHGRPAPDLTGLVDERLLARERLVFYFTSPDCGTCRPMVMFIDRLVAEHDNLIKVDITRDVALAHAFGVIITPTLILVRNGMVEQVLVGGRSEKKVRALLG